MKKLLKTSSMFAIAVILLTSMFAVLPVNVGASPGPTIFLEDPYGPNGQYIFDTTNVTTPFNVTIWVESSEPFDMNMFQLYLIYDHRYINVTSVSGVLRGWPNQNLGAREWDSDYVFYGISGGAIGNPVYYYIDASHGAVMWGDLVPSDVSVSGRKMLGRIEFEVVAYPPKGIGSYFDCVLNINNDDTFIYSSAGPVSGVTKNDGYYYLEWTVPPPVTPAVNPTLVEYGPWPPSAVGQAFDVQLLIKDVNPAWGMVNATLGLLYNASVIDVNGYEANVTIDSLWSSYKVTFTGIKPAIIKGADRLVALQSSTDFGWDWVVTGLTEHSANPSATNLYGVTALGLLDAYELTGNPVYFDACKAIADWIAWGNASEGDMYYGHDGFQFGYPEDYVFLVRFAEVSGNTTYRDYAIAGWEWTKENRGEYYGDGNQTNLYDYNLAHYGTHGGAIWNTADFALAALACGDYEWAKNMTDVIAANIPNIDETDDYRFIGWGKSLMAFQAVDPSAYAGVISDIVGNLTTSQQPDGSFSGWVQDEAYVTMGLAAVGELEMAKKTATWLIMNQGYDTIAGGWKLPDGNEYSEVTSEAVQALATIPTNEIYNMIRIFVGDPTETPSGDVPVATIKFTVMTQANSPPYPSDWVDESPLDICEAAIYDHTMNIPYNPPINGTVRIKALLTLPLPWLEIEPSSVTLGPEFAEGKEFEVKVKIYNLHFAWYMIAYQFVLHYDQSLLECVEIEEGPFLTNRLWNLYGTYFMPYSDPEPYDITVGGMLIPNPDTNEWDQTAFPDTINHPTIDNTLAIIRFRAIKQVAHYDLTDILYLDEFDNYLLSKDGNWIPVDKAKFVNCTYTMLAWPAVIDLHGGANNGGYGATIFPSPFGGQGPDNPMDLVIPQSEVYLFVNLTYKGWPLQNKEVSFEIIDNHGHTWGKFVDLTDSNGVASISFRMPWVCDDPERYLGVWTVVATARVGDKVVTDTMTFHYDYMVHIWKVVTDKYEYAHEEYIKVTVDYGTHAQQYYPALFTVTVTDELGVPIGIDARTSFQVGGAPYCEYKNGTFTVSIFIPKFAFAGYAYIHVCCFDKEPAEGGFAWCPEYEPVEIYILPE